ncbi:MAG: phosphoglycerate kinase [Candidatus Eremiobacteraeota bacterium]|uniref:phosphoglycerate kinase n=1 Tax=mine drainage metagenome TaxID=410659 RepID=E6PCN0_9ZZZZ|nr:phosphoglycerate kinase [Candidatus Eremiobacteraeota bacterium]
MSYATLDDLDCAGKRVLLREDFNVPLKDGAILDYTRIDAALPTLRRLQAKGARTIVLSHLGRPKGVIDDRYSLRLVAEALAKRLGAPVAFADDCTGEPARATVAALEPGGIALLENVRFHAGEETNDVTFARALAENGDLFVNDAFGAAHRAHASTEALAHLLPCAAGPLLELEIRTLSRLLGSPERPFVCAIGGAKVRDKVALFTHLMDRVDAFCVGGGMANTFLAAKGVHVGRSLRDDDLDPAREILVRADGSKVQIHLPSDAVVAPSFDADDRSHVVAIDDVGDEMILDIGPLTAKAYADALSRAKTIVFNGPMGVYEKESYRAGTRAVGDAIARATKHAGFTVVGGGDAAAAATLLGFANRVSHVSTGGGATLEFLEGRTLPGIAALERA